MLRKIKRSRLYKLVRKHVRLLISLFCVILAATWLSVSFFHFSRQIIEHGEQSMLVQLNSVTSQSASIIRYKSDDLIRQMNQLAAIFGEIGDIHSDDTLGILAEVAKNSIFGKVRLSTLDGESYSSSGSKINIKERDYFRDAINGNSGVSKALTSIYDDSAIVTVYSPVYQRGELIGTIHGTCDEGGLSGAIRLDTFGGKGFVRVFEKDGTIIFSGGNPPTGFVAGDLVWSSLSSGRFESGYNAESLKSDVQVNKSGNYFYVENNERYIGSYAPIGVNDWYILQTVPSKMLEASNKQVLFYALMLILRTLVLFIFLLATVTFLLKRTQRTLLLANREMQISNELFKIASSHTIKTVFELDVKTEKIVFIGELPPPLGLSREIENGPTHILSSGVIDPQSVDAFIDLFEKIKNGERAAQAVIKTWKADVFTWDKLMLTNVFDDDNRPIRAIGTLEDVTDRIAAEMRYAQEEQYRKAVESETCRVYEINVTKNELRKPGTGEAKQYSLEMLRMCESLVYSEDRESFLEVAQRGRLLRSFEMGMPELVCEYRTYAGNGVLSWSSSTTHLLRNPDSSDIMGYTYVRDINAQKQLELTLRRQAEYDQLTGLYNRSTTEKKISKILALATNENIHAFFYIDIDCFKAVNDSYGHIAGDTLLESVSKKLADLTRSDDILGRMGGDEFVLFVKDVQSESRAREIATRICDTMRSTVFYDSTDSITESELQKQRVAITASIGVVMFPQYGKTFEALYRTSDIALYHAKYLGKNQFAFYKDGMVIESENKK